MAKVTMMTGQPGRANLWEGQEGPPSTMRKKILIFVSVVYFSNMTPCIYVDQKHTTYGKLSKFFFLNNFESTWIMRKYKWNYSSVFIV